MSSADPCEFSSLQWLACMHVLIFRTIILRIDKLVDRRTYNTTIIGLMSHSWLHLRRACNCFCRMGVDKSCMHAHTESLAPKRTLFPGKISCLLQLYLSWYFHPQGSSGSVCEYYDCQSCVRVHQLLESLSYRSTYNNYFDRSSRDNT